LLFLAGGFYLTTPVTPIAASNNLLTANSDSYRVEACQAAERHRSANHERSAVRPCEYLGFDFYFACRSPPHPWSNVEVSKQVLSCGAGITMARILVIDDDANLREIYAEMLTAAGYEVAEAGNGKEGVRLYNNAPFDLVLTDLLMPEKDGLEVIIELRKDFPEVKIITLSGGDAYGHSSLGTSKLLGALRTLRKPFMEDELLEAVREVLKSS